METPKFEANEASVMSKIQDWYRSHPFLKNAVLVGGLAGALGASKVEGQTLDEVPANLSFEELREQVQEDLKAHPEVITAVEDLYAYQMSEAAHGETVDWHGSAVHQSIRGAENLNSISVNYPEVPRSGSGLFRMSSMLGTVESSKEGETVSYSGLARNFNLQFDPTVTPVSEPLSFEIEVHEHDNVNELIIEGFAAEISYRHGKQMEVQDVVTDRSDVQGVGTAYESRITSQFNHTIAEWKIEQTGENTYTVTYRDGWVTSPDSSETVQPGN